MMIHIEVTIKDKSAVEIENISLLRKNTMENVENRIILAYSLKKINTNPIDEYSILNPDTSSDSPSAKSKGVPPPRIFTKHQVRNAILPVVTVLGPSIASITTGGFVVELVFAIPGLGRYFVQAVQQLDYTVIMGTTVFYGAFLVFMVILVDVLYGLIDPRVRVEQ